MRGGQSRDVRRLSPLLASLQEELLKFCCSSLFDISDAIAKSDELRDLLAQSGAVKAVIASIRSQPKLEESVTSAVRFLESYATVRACMSCACVAYLSCRLLLLRAHSRCDCRVQLARCCLYCSSHRSVRCRV
jgi:hypothetical protein